jgi:hypothetical protein
MDDLFQRVGYFIVYLDKNKEFKQTADLLLYPKNEPWGKYKWILKRQFDRF